MVGPPRYRHHEDEILHILEGCLAFQCGTEQFDAAAGSIIVAPAGTPHCWFNFGPSRPAWS